MDQNNVWSKLDKRKAQLETRKHGSLDDVDFALKKDKEKLECQVRSVGYS